MGVDRGHAQGIAGRADRRVAKGDLADEQVDVGVLQEGSERVPKALRASRFV